MSRTLSAWIERESPIALRGMLKSVSPVGITHQRAGFGQTIVPKRGAIVASPVPGAYVRIRIIFTIGFATPRSLSTRCAWPIWTVVRALD